MAVQTTKNKTRLTTVYLMQRFKILNQSSTNDYKCYIRWNQSSTRFTYYARIHFLIPTSANHLHLNRMAQTVAHPISNKKWVGSDLGPDTQYHDLCSPWRTSVTPEKLQDTQVRLQALRSISFKIHYSPLSCYLTIYTLS